MGTVCYLHYLLCQFLPPPLSPPRKGLLQKPDKAVAEEDCPRRRAANKAIQSMSWADAKAQVAIVKQTLTDDTESFWTAQHEG